MFIMSRVYIKLIDPLTASLTAITYKLFCALYTYNKYLSVVVLIRFDSTK